MDAHHDEITSFSKSQTHFNILENFLQKLSELTCNWLDFSKFTKWLSLDML